MIRRCTPWLAGSVVIAAMAGTSANATGQVECIGHHTVVLPGAFEYSLAPSNRLGDDRFAGGLAPRDTHVDVRFDHGPVRPISVSREATEADLQSLFEEANAGPQAKKNEFLAWIKQQDEDPTHAVDPTGEDRKLFVQRAEQVQFYQRVPARKAFVWPGNDRPNVYVLLNGHILSGRSAADIPPQARVDNFAGHFKARGALEVPAGNDTCIPSFTIAGDDSLDSVGLNMRLVDRPDIVVYFEEDEAASDAQDPKRFIVEATQPGRTFVDSVEARPLDRLKATHKITIAGRDGLGAFAEVKREGTSANTGNHDLDWAFVGYVPGRTGLRPGQSQNIVLKVERFGRFARQPMSEAEFRTLVKDLTDGIRRHDGSPAHE